MKLQLSFYTKANETIIFIEQNGNLNDNCQNKTANELAIVIEQNGKWRGTFL